MITTNQLQKRVLPPQMKLTADDFYFDESGNLLVDPEKIVQVINFQSTKSNREPIKGGVSPI
jgi:hypothetical protein